MNRHHHGDPLRGVLQAPPILEEEDSLGANYLADDCTVRCGLCDQRVNGDGLCPDCDSGEIERQRHGDDDDREDFDV